MFPFVSGFLMTFSIMFSGFIHAVACTSISFLFMTLNNKLYGYTTLCVSIHRLLDICVYSTFWLLWIILPWTFTYNFYMKICLQFSWIKYREVELLGHMLILCLTFWGTAKLFHSGCTIYIPSSSVWVCECMRVWVCECISVWVFQLLHTLTNTCSFLFFSFLFFF